MIFVSILWVIILAVYVQCLYRILFQKWKYSTKTPLSRDVTIVIPVRNEMSRLPTLLQEIELLCQRSPGLEVILVDDHSSTVWWEELTIPESIVVIAQKEKGKKFAIKNGVERASNSIIFQCDADLDLGGVKFDLWERSENELFSLVPLSPSKGRGLIRKFFDVEFSVLHFIGLESMKRGRPLLSNGAALIYSKQAFLDTVQDRDDWELASGDDMFLMIAIQKKWGSKSLGVVRIDKPVPVGFPNSLKILFNQRVRWAGKSPKVESIWFKAVTILSAIVILGLPIMLLLALKSDADVLLSTTIGMWVVLGFISIKAVRVLYRSDLLGYVPLFMLIYPFYLFMLLIAILTRRPDWR